MSWEGSDRAKRLPKGWASIRRAILTRDPVCRICGHRQSVEVDHIIHGNDHSPSNLRGLCWSCHARKTSQEGNAARRRFSNKRKPERHPGLR